MSAKGRADLDITSVSSGQLEIGVQEARKRRPGLSDDALLELAKTVMNFPELVSLGLLSAEIRSFARTVLSRIALSEYPLGGESEHHLSEA